MKKILFLLTLLMGVITINAQVEYLYDFNSLTTGLNCLDGQDNWSTYYMTAPTSPDFDVDYTDDGLLSPDESIAVFYPYGGPGVGRTATRKATDNFNFNFQDGGIIDLEFDIIPSWWGDFVGVGYDADGDGNILPGMTAGDGGIYILIKGSENNNKPEIVFPNNPSVMISNFTQDGWARYKMSFDFSAYEGAGSLTVFVKTFDENGWSEWSQLSEATELNMGLTPGSGDKNDYQVWDGIFFHCQGGTGGFDNILVRQMPEGNMQYINMLDIPKQLTINPPYTLEATATSGLPVSFEMISGPATIEGNILTLTGEVGTVSLKATQAGNSTWLPAPDVIKTFEVIDPMAYSPEIKIRRPYNETNVYLPELKPIILCVSLQIEHPDALHFEEVKCTIGDEDIFLNTDYPDDYENGYFFNYWEPKSYGEQNITLSVTTTGGKTTTATSSFTITNEYETMDVVTIDGDLICTPSVHSAKGEYVLPTHVGAFNLITAHYDHNCVNGHCDTYDRVGGIRIRNFRGEWMELFRYISPFGIECEDNVDVTDYSSSLQGLVEMEFFFESWNGDGFNPTLTFEMTKGTPDYLYTNVEEIWHDTYPFGDYANQQPVPEVNYTFDPNTISAKLKIITTGHNWSSGVNGTYNTGNAGEFYEATHHIKVNDQTEFTQDLWEICNPNPAGCQPQNGTWTHNRSGWCPGSIAMVWDFDLTSHINENCTNLFYEFDPTYIDECHPNYPDCVNGQNSCPDCDAPDNPILKVSGKVISYSNHVDVLTNAPTIVENESFNVDIFPNPAQSNITFTSDYNHGKLSVLILNSQGQEVRKFAFSGSKTIDVTDLSSGIYFVKILGRTMVIKKIVIR